MGKLRVDAAVVAPVTSDKVAQYIDVPTDGPAGAGPKWRITRDLITNGDSDGVVGPGDAPDDSHDGQFTWIPFKLYDDDGELYYEGEMNEHCDDFAPLDNFGMPNAGCTRIDVFENGQWMTV